MIRSFLILITAGLLSACTNQQLWSTAQTVKNLDCDYSSTEAYKRCDTNLEEEYRLAQEQQRQQDEQMQKEKDIQEALERSVPEEKTQKSN